VPHGPEKVLNFEAIRAKGEALGLLKAGQAVTQNELIALGGVNK